MNKRNLLIFFYILIVFIGYKIYIYRTYLDSIDEVTRINTLAKETASKTIDSLKQEWSIRENTDEMTDKTTKLASIMSHNTVNFDFLITEVLGCPCISERRRTMLMFISLSVMVNLYAMNTWELMK